MTFLIYCLTSISQTYVNLNKLYFSTQLLPLTKVPDRYLGKPLEPLCCNSIGIELVLVVVVYSLASTKLFIFS